MSLTGEVSHIGGYSDGYDYPTYPPYQPQRFPYTVPQGWECPRCKAINNPNNALCVGCTYQWQRVDITWDRSSTAVDTTGATMDIIGHDGKITKVIK